MLLPASFGYNHLGSKLIEFIPKSFHLQLNVNVGHFRVLFHQVLVRRGARGRGRTVRGPSLALLGLDRVWPRVVVTMLGRRARLKVGVMLAVRVPGGRREMITPWRIEAAQAAGREGCNIAKMGQLRQPRTGYCWNHSKSWIYNVRSSSWTENTIVLHSWNVIKMKVKFHKVLSKWKGSLKRVPHEASSLSV